MTDRHNVDAALAALGGGPKKVKAGTGPVEATMHSSGSAVEDLGALAKKNAGVPQDLLALAQRAAIAADESRAAGAKAKALKAELESAMKEADVAEIEMDDRDPILFATKPEKQKTLKALKGRMAAEAEKNAGADADLAKTKAEAEAKAKSVWDEFWVRFPSEPKTTLEIPKPHVIEPSQ